MEKRTAIASILAGITFALGLTNTIADAQLLVAGAVILVGLFYKSARVIYL